MPVRSEAVLIVTVNGLKAGTSAMKRTPRKMIADNYIKHQTGAIAVQQIGGLVGEV
jgi:hypothetical protein